MNLEQIWNQEYRDFMLSFYPESSPIVSTWQIYRMAKVKSQKEIKNLLELTETLNQIRDNLQDENRKLEQELQRTRDQLSKAENILSKYEIIHINKPELLDVANEIKDYFIVKSLKEQLAAEVKQREKAENALRDIVTVAVFGRDNFLKIEKLISEYFSEKQNQNKEKKDEK